MYINDIYILWYIIFAVVGFGIGLFLGWCAERLPQNKKIFSKKIFLEYKAGFKSSYYYLGIINAILYLSLLCIFGINPNFISNLMLIKYLALIPMLILVFVIDIKLTIIPNRLNLTLFEVGLVVCFVQGISSVSNFSQALDPVFGMLVGGGVFLLLNVVGALIAGKEAMGMGDVKLMGALGLFFGLINTIVIIALAFLIAAVVSIVIIIYRKIKKIKDSYIPFGPFIVVSTVIVIFVPNNMVIDTLLKIFTLGMYS
ncbi:MAG: A24 family peptidase [Oscillospiraceae bacterium]|nr:A24 family peptidase [Oscillospiraceae bacterium]